MVTHKSAHKYFHSINSAAKTHPEKTQYSNVIFFKESSRREEIVLLCSISIHFARFNITIPEESLGAILSIRSFIYCAGTAMIIRSTLHRILSYSSRSFTFFGSLCHGKKKGCSLLVRILDVIASFTS